MAKVRIGTMQGSPFAKLSTAQEYLRKYRITGDIVPHEYGFLVEVNENSTYQSQRVNKATLLQKEAPTIPPAYEPQETPSHNPAEIQWVNDFSDDRPQSVNTMSNTAAYATMAPIKTGGRKVLSPEESQDFLNNNHQSIKIGKDIAASIRANEEASSSVSKTKRGRPKLPIERGSIASLFSEDGGNAGDRHDMRLKLAGERKISEQEAAMFNDYDMDSMEAQAVAQDISDKSYLESELAAQTKEQTKEQASKAKEEGVKAKKAKAINTSDGALAKPKAAYADGEDDWARVYDLALNQGRSMAQPYAKGGADRETFNRERAEIESQYQGAWSNQDSISKGKQLLKEHNVRTAKEEAKEEAFNQKQEDKAYKNFIKGGEKEDEKVIKEETKKAALAQKQDDKDYKDFVVAGEKADKQAAKEASFTQKLNDTSYKRFIEGGEKADTSDQKESDKAYKKFVVEGEKADKLKKKEEERESEDNQDSTNKSLGNFSGALSRAVKIVSAFAIAITKAEQSYRKETTETGLSEEQLYEFRKGYTERSGDPDEAVALMAEQHKLVVYDKAVKEGRLTDPSQINEYKTLLTKSITEQNTTGVNRLDYENSAEYFRALEKSAAGMSKEDRLILSKNVGVRSLAYSQDKAYGSNDITSNIANLTGSAYETFKGMLVGAFDMRGEGESKQLEAFNRDNSNRKLPSVIPNTAATISGKNNPAEGWKVIGESIINFFSNNKQKIEVVGTLRDQNKTPIDATFSAKEVTPWSNK